MVYDPSDSWASTGTIPDNRRIRNVIAQWPEWAIGQIPFRELYAPHELALSYWSAMSMDDLVTEHYPPFIAPTIPQIEPLGTEVSCDEPNPVNYSF